MTPWPVGREEILGQLQRLEMSKVVADRTMASEMLDVASTHLVSVRTLADSDPTLAYAALHDAIRKSMAAVLQAQGLRATSKGGHVAVQAAFEAQFGRSMGSYLRSVNRIRVRRNELEYPHKSTSVEADEVFEDMPAGTKIVEACQALLDQLDVFS